MCSAYWTLKTTIACPECGDVRERELQTHWCGEIGSCVNYYALGQKVDELAGVDAGVMDGEDDGDEFIEECAACKAFSTFGARIEAGAVVEVWPLKVRA